jgi:replicative DNA helicase
VTTAAITAHNIPAEQALLGILIASPQLADSCGIRPGDLDAARGHDVVLSALLDLYETKHTSDPILLADHLSKRDQLARVGAEDARAGVYLAELVTAGRGLPSVHHYARLVREATVRRRIYEIGTRLVQTSTGQADLDAVLEAASGLTLSLGMLVDQPIDGDAPIPGLSLVSEFINEPSPAHSWVIPGVLERADRVMIVAGEGAGKSMLARQVCTLLAAGRHPFAPKSLIPARRTLLVDLENPPDLVRRSLRNIVGQVHAEGLDVEDRAWRWNHPSGMDLRSPADRTLLTRAIEQARPDLVAIGPLYKASSGRPGDTYEIAAAETAAVIDQLRERYGCAFWIEHHAPKADQSGRRSDPVGSSYWMRWPEFGLVLKAAPNSEPNVYELARFRGDRDVRCWPDRLLKAAGRWPWTADYDPETQADLFDAIDEDRQP